MQHPLNSIEWTEYKIKLDHWSSLEVAGIPIVYKSFPFLGKLGIVYMFPPVTNASQIEKSCQRLYDLFKQSGIDYLIAKPFLLIEQEKFWGELKALSPSDILLSQLPDTTLSYKDTYVVDLSRGIEECFMSFSATKRNEIRQVGKNPGIKVQINEGIDWQEFYANYDKNMRAKKAPVLSKERVNFILQAFNKGNGLLLVKVVNQADNSSYYTCCLLKDGLGLYLFGSYDWSENRISKMLPKYTIYLAMKKIAEMNFSYFDLGGIDLADPKKAGINNFKKGFGGILSSSDPILIARKSNGFNAKFIKFVLRLKEA